MNVKSPMSSDPTIRLVTRQDYKQWLPLWDGYNAFYERSCTNARSLRDHRGSIGRRTKPIAPRCSSTTRWRTVPGSSSTVSFSDASMIRTSTPSGCDPVGEHRFSCSNYQPEHDDDSSRSHR